MQGGTWIDPLPLLLRRARSSASPRPPPGVAPRRRRAPPPLCRPRAHRVRSPLIAAERRDGGGRICKPERSPAHPSLNQAHASSKAPARASRRLHARRRRRLVAPHRDAARRRQPRAARRVQPYHKLNIFTRPSSPTWRTTTSRDVDQDKPVDGAIRGMLETLDPHTSFLDPAHTCE